ncbi:hypothetical protein BJ993_004560 [Nocardioides aromaticivorans]|uniref:Secreted protein n=1 Tax=Nocardioides aromaticivorans TaxID=200618 RepID=A0A7Y9ZMB1_9ACTN|nr:hypothetical protein [Nocardioides aromaticivorans]NYI47480.1 hypothetical protein [Nocardioides aromaticivorans]
MARVEPATATRRPAALLLGLLVALAVASGCSDDTDPPEADPSAPLSDVTVDCDRYEDTAQRITDAQTALYDGKDSPEDATAVDDLVGELEALEDDAPDDVDAALNGLADGFRSAQELLADPEAADPGELSALSAALAEDSQAVTAWILSQCEG